jgi:hypothetical protein
MGREKGALAAGTAPANNPPQFYLYFSNKYK